MLKIFIDANILFAAGYSLTGSARDLLLSFDEKVELVVSSLVLEEAQRNIAKKAPHKLDAYTVLLQNIKFTLAEELSKEEILAVAQYTELKDAPVVAAALKAGAEYLVTYDRKHLIEPTQVAEKSGLKIVTPDVVVALLRLS
jgi:predicted nucleic acid-binding protein